MDANTAFANDHDSLEIIDTKMTDSYSPGVGCRPNTIGFRDSGDPPVYDPGCTGRPYTWKNGSVNKPQRATNKKWLQSFADSVSSTTDRIQHFLQFLWVRPLSRATPKSWRHAAPTIGGTRPSEDESQIAGTPAPALIQAKQDAEDLLNKARYEAVDMEWHAHYTRLQRSGVKGALSAADLLNADDGEPYIFGKDQTFMRFPLVGREGFWLTPEAEDYVRMFHGTKLVQWRRKVIRGRCEGRGGTTGRQNIVRAQGSLFRYGAVIFPMGAAVAGRRTLQSSD